MTDIFINNIIVNKSRNISDLKIPLAANERKHLILTGKNGSGKTSLMEELTKYLGRVLDGGLENLPLNITKYKNQKQNLKVITSQNPSDTRDSTIRNLSRNIKSLENFFESFGGTEIQFNNKVSLFDRISNNQFIMSYFPARRISKMDTPTGFEKIKFSEKYRLDAHANNKFIQYLVNQYADRSFARERGDSETIDKITEWFVNLENRLKIVFDNENLELIFDSENYNFNIVLPDMEPFSFNNLADGYSAIIDIVAELLMRMESVGANAYDLNGIVLIDEIETHLHVDLQKKVLPFLIDFFPKIQYIITTHSPFVIQSISNSVICDLEKKIITQDLSSYSYDALIESFFNIDKYSEEVKDKIERYDQLNRVEDIKDEEQEELRELKK